MHDGYLGLREGALSAMSDFSDIDEDGERTSRTGSPPRIVPQGGDCGDWRDDERSTDCEIVASVRAAHADCASEDPAPLPGYSRVHFVWSH